MSMDWRRLMSRQRLGVTRTSLDSELRSAFQRDFDRIVFSSAFRRLQDKTQVFPLARTDYVRTRLTHSLEVSSVGRSLGNMVGDSLIRQHGLVDWVAADVGTVVAAACLAHDIGNPPFGHAGEDAIREWFARNPRGQAVMASLTAAQQGDFLAFEGNAQGFRLLTRLQSPDNSGGMQLTTAVLATFTKYPRTSDQPPPTANCAFRKFGVFGDDIDAFAAVASSVGLPAADTRAWSRHPLAYLVEAADDICYLIVDTEDAFRSGLLDYPAVERLLEPLAEASRARLTGLSRDKERVEYLRARAIGRLVDQVHTVFLEREAELLNGTQEQPLLALVPDTRLLHDIAVAAREQVYASTPVVEVGAAGFQVLFRLLDAFVEAVEDVAIHGDDALTRNRMVLRLMPDQLLGPDSRLPDDPYRRLLAVTDFVSGMTDRYAVSLFRRLTGMTLGSP